MSASGPCLLEILQCHHHQMIAETWPIDVALIFCARVDGRNNCFCGHSNNSTYCGPATTSCSVRCRGNLSETCGGDLAVFVYEFTCDDACTPIHPGPAPAPLPPPPPPPPAINYSWPPVIHWAQGCLEGPVTHDISGGIIQTDGTFHTWIGCFNAEPGGGWQHIVSRDLLSWKLAAPFTGKAPAPHAPHIEAGAVGIDDDGTAFAVESVAGTLCGTSSNVCPFNAYRFTNASNDAWGPAEVLFSYASNRGLPGDPPRPWRDPRDNKWYALMSFNGCNESLLTHPSEKSACPKGGEAKMWSSPALFGPAAKWEQTPSLLVTNATVLDGENGLPNRPSMTEMVTSDFFPVQGHPKVNAVFLTSRYDKDALEPGVTPDPDGGTPIDFCVNNQCQSQWRFNRLMA